VIRRAIGRDERRLRRLDREGWSTLHNVAGRALYDACGFHEVGRLRALFHLDGAYVDDVWMALNLTPSG